MVCRGWGIVHLFYYMFSELTTYNNSGANADWGYTNRRIYGLNYGTYFINSTKYITVLNKNKENLISLSGSSSTTVHVPYLTTDQTIDGSYNFFTGDMTLKVVGDFGTCSLYIKDEGYCNLYDCLVFDNLCC